jgi:CO/xanthine dehydrogenase FAD-binding subunit
MVEDETLLEYAAGLLPRVLKESGLGDEGSWQLARSLRQTDSNAARALVTTLLVLDAEINAKANDETWVWPLPGFLSYRSRLPVEKFSLTSLRLPPLNLHGHYRFTVLDKVHYLAVRMDIHPQLRVTGHVRIAVSGLARQPGRVQKVEHRLERQVLDGELIAAAVAEAGKEEPALDAMTRAGLTELLGELAVA